MNYAKQFSLLVFLLTATACAAPTGTADPALQGEWKARFVNKIKIGNNGLRCWDGTATMNIDGTRFRGVARTEHKAVYYVQGTQVAEGSIKGQFRLGMGLPFGTFEGRTKGGGLQGTFLGPDGCRGNWTATRVT